MTRRHFRNFVFFPFSVLVIIVILIWVAAPFVAKHYLASYFQSQDKTSSIDSLSIDFFPPKVDIKNLVVTDQEDDTLTLKRATFEIQIWPLFARTLNISKANIEGLDIKVTQQENDWIVAGINTSQYLEAEPSEEKTSKPEENEETKSSPWSIKLPIFSFTNSHLSLSRQPELTTPAQSDSFTLEKLILNDVSGQGLQWKGDVDLSVLINEATFSINSQFDYSPDLVKADVQIDNTRLPFSSFKHFIPAPYQDSEGLLNLDGRFQLQQTYTDNDPLIEIKELTLNTVVEDLNVNLTPNDRIQTKSTQLSISQADIRFASTDELNATFTLALTSTESSFTQTDLVASYESFNLSNTLSLAIEGDLLTAKNDQLNVNLQEIKASIENEKQVSLEALTLTADQIDANIENQQNPSLSGSNLAFSSTSLDSFLADNKRIASWQNASFNGLSFTQQGDTFSATLTDLNMEDLTLSELLTATDSTQTLPPLGHIGSINVKNVEADQNGAAIDTITTDSMKISIIFDANKTLANLIFPQEQPSETEQTAPKPSLQGSGIPKESDANKVIANASDANQNPAFKAPYYVALKAYDTTGDSSVYVQDKSITPTLQRLLTIDTLSLRDLNTQDKEQATVFSLKARNGKYSTLDSDITIWPLADQLTMQSQLAIKEAELPPYSSYIANALGYQIDSGHLDLDLTLNSDDGVLDGEANILLRQFNLGGRQESNSVIKAGAIPLNIAVGILKDSNDNIDLDIPLSGDINNPEFGWTDFLILPVRKALYKVSSNYLMQTFVPYANVITIAQYAGEQLLKVRVEPLIFDPEDTQPNDSQDAFLQQLTALMKDKKDSQLKACGITNYQDLGFETPPATLDDDVREQAQSLAQERADNLKEYLVEQGIDSSRILLCSPAVDLSKNSQPRIELNF